MVTKQFKSDLAAQIVADPRWQVLLTKSLQGQPDFYYSVATTGVYCKPTCASRLPRPENVRFHSTREDAIKAGFRACKRCKPDQASLQDVHANTIAAACKIIEQSVELPTLKDLATQSGLSDYYFHRLFKSIIGITPKEYAVAHRNKKIRKHLATKSTVTNAIYDAGFNSNSRFYENSGSVLGMTPKAYRAGGKDTEIKFALAECSLGSILVASSNIGVCAIFLGDDPSALLKDLQDQFPNSTLIGGDAAYEHGVANVLSFVDAPHSELNLPLDIRGTAFQQRVWQELKRIPIGDTASYSDIAERIGSPKSVRAVAQACAANKLAVVIPCHRVIKNDGSLSGYRWGVERKKSILESEKNYEKQ